MRTTGIAQQDNKTLFPRNARAAVRPPTTATHPEPNPTSRVFVEFDKYKLLGSTP